MCGGLRPPQDYRTPCDPNRLRRSDAMRTMAPHQ
jgi:hypothetical protein